VANLSNLDIANLGLSHLGEDGGVEDFNEKSTPARQAKLWYNPCRRETLEKFDWSFARKRQALALHGEAPPEGVWNFRYQYPVDAIAPRYIVNPAGTQADPVPFMVEIAPANGTRSILTDIQDAILVYTFDCEDASAFSPSFATALSYCLAWRMSPVITKKLSLTNAAGAAFTRMFNLSSAMNANAQAFDTPRDAAWVEARR
jgi:hypothetical protein